MFGIYFFPLLLSMAFINIHVNAKPIDEEPKKLTLDIPIEILNSTNIRVPTRWEKGVELLGQFMDAIRFGTGRLVNFGMMARNEIANRAEEFTSEAANKILSLIAARDAQQYIQKTNRNAIQQQIKRSTPEMTTAVPDKIATFGGLIPLPTRETVNLESEAKQGIFEIKKPNPLENLLESSPVVDRTREEDKYGNSGGIGRPLVNGVQGLSNFFNSLLDFPGNAAQQITKNVNVVLNHLGGRFLGLQ